MPKTIYRDGNKYREIEKTDNFTKALKLALYFFMAFAILLFIPYLVDVLTEAFGGML